MSKYLGANSRNKTPSVAFGEMTNKPVSFRFKHALVKSCQSFQGQGALFHFILTCSQYQNRKNTTKKENPVFLCRRMLETDMQQNAFLGFSSAAKFYMSEFFNQVQCVKQ